MSIKEGEAADQLAATAPTGSPGFFKLPDFWTASPAARFGVVEAKFLLRGTTSQQDCFALVAAALPGSSPAHCLPKG